MVDPETLYAQLSVLLASVPDFAAPGPLSQETETWLARAYALVQAPEPEVEVPGDDPHERLMEIIEAWIDADKANPKDARIAQLEAENARLRGEDPKALQAPEAEAETERVIDPPTSDIFGPREFAESDPGPRPGPDDHKVLRPKPTIEGEATVVPPQNDPPPGLRRVPGIHSPPALSGAETERRRQSANARRDVDFKIMNQRIGRNAPQPSLGNESWRGHTKIFE
jgi:hypothetical protein